MRKAPEVTGLRSSKRLSGSRLLIGTRLVGLLLASCVVATATPEERKPAKTDEQPAPRREPQRAPERPVQRQEPQRAPERPVQRQEPQRAPERPVQRQEPQRTPERPAQRQEPRQDPGVRRSEDRRENNPFRQREPGATTPIKPVGREPRPEAERPSTPSPLRPAPLPAGRPEVRRDPEGARPGPGREDRTEPPIRSHPQGDGRRGEPGRPGGTPQSPVFAPPVERRGPERQVFRPRGGGEIQRTPTGAIREVHTPGGAVIRHSPNGVRNVQIVRPGGRVIIANGSGRSGYIQRPYSAHGRTFVQRTYVINGIARPRIYRPWFSGGREYHIYAPTRHYHPAFYTWAHSRWYRPVHYRWGWGARPWYAYYGGYFTPYPTYESPAFWLADFVIATTLEASYLAQNASTSEAPVRYDSSTGMSPEAKEAIAEEVRRQLEQEQEDRDAGEAPPALFSSQGPKVFLVSGDAMAYSGNRECPLQDGDVLQLASRPAPGSEWAEVRILSSRGSGCPRGSVVAVRTVDLQEMQNQMQATLDQGMERLQSDQGKDGLPALPEQAVGGFSTTYADGLQAESDALDELSLAVKDANRMEQEIIIQGEPEPTTGGPAGTTISLGMTFAQVEAVLGRPRNTVDLGAKRILLFKDLKVTFLNGRVSDVQ